jgi:ABC-type molybdate transport system substrate-binding protein
MKRKLLATLVVAALAAAGCSDDGDGGDNAAPQVDPEALHIAAASGVSSVVNRLADTFEQESPQIDVAVTLHGKEGLIDVAESGNPDLVIFPDAWQLDTGDAAVAPFGRNLAVLVTPPGNPANVQGLEAFGEGSTARVLACGPELPFGNLIAIVLVQANVSPRPGTVEADCEQEAADRVAAGDLDAALMFRTAIGTRNDVATTPVAGDANIVLNVSYYSPNPSPDVERFVAFVESTAGEEIRTAEGLLP